MEVVEGAYLHASKENRSTLLIPKKQDSTKKQELRIIGQYDICSTKVRNTIGKYWDLLKLDPTLKGIIPSSPLITFRKGRRLRDRLVNSHWINQTWEHGLNDPWVALDVQTVATLHQVRLLGVL